MPVIQHAIRSGARGTRLTTFAGALLAICLAALAAVIATPATARAAEVTGITSLTITEPTDQIKVWDRIAFEATWAVPDTATAGDTFRLAFPTSPSLTGVRDSFALTAPDGQTVGTCEVSTGELVCTLTDYVDSHTDVSGTLHFRARADEETTLTEIPFTTGGGTVVPVDVPGGIGPVPEFPAPSTPTKWGDVTLDGRNIAWGVNIPSSALAGDAPTLTDTFTAGLVLDPASVTVAYVLAKDWAGGKYTVSTAQQSGSDFTVTEVSSESFTVTVDAPIVADAIYVLRYKTALPTDVRPGDAFHNTVTGSRWVTESTPVIYSQGGGDGEGVLPVGGFTVTKEVSGSGAALVPDDREFRVAYSYQRAGQAVEGELALRSGQTDGLKDMPAGTVVTLSEVTPADVDGVTWQAPVFSGTGVATTDGGAIITIARGATVAVTLTNPTTVTPPPVGGFTVTKNVTGPGTSLVPADQTFTVEYSYELAGQPVTGELALRAGESEGLADLPAGTVVTLREKAPSAVEGVTWKSPRFTGAGVDVGDGGATLTISEDATVGVLLTNGTGVTPPPPPGGELALTGSEGPAGPLALGAMLLLAGVVALGIRQRVAGSRTGD